MSLETGWKVFRRKGFKEVFNPRLSLVIPSAEKDFNVNKAQEEI